MSNNRALKLSPACIKTLTRVEVDPSSSHQHEFNGVAELKEMFGVDKKEFSANFSIRGEKLSEVVGVTWYEARDSHPTRSEYRLYFKSNTVMNNANVGDNIIIGFDSHKVLNCVLIRKDGEGYQGPVSGWQKL